MSTSAPIHRTTIVVLVVDLPRPRRHRPCPSRSSRVRWLLFHRGRGGCHCSRVREPSCLRVCRCWALLVVSGPTHPAWWSSSHRRWARFTGVGLRWGDSSPLTFVILPLRLLVVSLVLHLLVLPLLLLLLLAPPCHLTAPLSHSSSVSQLLCLTAPLSHCFSVSPLLPPSSSSLPGSSVKRG